MINFLDTKDVLKYRNIKRESSHIWSSLEHGLYITVNHFVYTENSVIQIMHTIQFLSNSKTLSNLVQISLIYRVSSFQEAIFSIFILFTLPSPTCLELSLR